MIDLLAGLNERQQAAVLAKDGPLLIIAGAGAGKTKTITHRIGHLIASDVPPEAILAITFTNKAAREMRERALKLIGKEGAAGSWMGGWRGIPWIGTFHALGVYILREKGEVIGIPRRFTVLDKDDALSFVKRAMKDCGIESKEFPPSKVQSLISRKKSDFGESDADGKSGWDKLSSNRFLVQMVRRVYDRYVQLLRDEQALDFDDLLVRTVEILDGHPEVLNYYRATWRYVHVDEYQDTNAVQYKLVRLLADGHRNICVVGDSDQNIYSWRGASIANILNFEEDYPGATIVLLEENYRSTGHILDAANAIIAKNTLRKEKNLFTRSGKGDKVLLREAYDEGDEARWVTKKIAELMEKGIRPSEIAILYRTNFQSRILEESLLYAGVPYHVLGVRFFDRKEVKDVLAYLRAANNPASVLDVTRSIAVPPRGIGKVTLEKVLAGKKDELPSSTRVKVDAYFSVLSGIQEAFATKKPSELVAYAIDVSGVAKLYSSKDEEDLDRLANTKELVSVATKYDLLPSEEGVPALLADIALASDQDNMNEKKDAVRLMTVHAAKGLEFPYVFITGMEQDLFPSRRRGEDDDILSAQEEERRLFYVALTRAAKRVFLTWASFRTIFGQRNMTAPSEFLSDIPEHLIEEEETVGGETSARRGGFASGAHKDRKKFSLLDPLDGSDDTDDILYF